MYMYMYIYIYIYVYMYMYIYKHLCFYDQRTGNIPNCNLPIAQTSHRDFGVGTIPKVTANWYFSIWLGQKLGIH